MSHQQEDLDNIQALQTSNKNAIVAAISAVAVAVAAVGALVLTFTTEFQEASFLDIAQGNVAGYTHVNKFGENESSAIDTQEPVWDGSTTYQYPTAADSVVRISQTTNQEAMLSANIEIQGLDASWNLAIDTVALDGSNTTTPVTLPTPLIRVFRMKVLANVVSNSPIRVHNTAETVDYAIISTGMNQTLMALYTVPNGKTAYITQYYVSITRSAALDPTGTDVKLWAADRDAGYEFQLKHSIGLPQSTTPYSHPFKPYMKVTQKTDIKLTTTCDSKAGQVHGGFDLILVDNE